MTAHIFGHTYAITGDGRMVRSYRSRDEIVVDILNAAIAGARKNHIMQKANLNPLMFKKYFPVLLKNGFIVKEDDPGGGSVYSLSDDGKELLRAYRTLRARFRKKAVGEEAIPIW